MPNNIISEIREYEKQAEEKIKKATADAARYMDEARLQAEKESQAEYEMAIKKAGSIIESAEKAASEEAEQIMKQGKTKTEDLCNKAKQNMSAAVDAILSAVQL